MLLSTGADTHIITVEDLADHLAALLAVVLTARRGALARGDPHETWRCDEQIFTILLVGASLHLDQDALMGYGEQLAAQYLAIEH